MVFGMAVSWLFNVYMYGVGRTQGTGVKVVDWLLSQLLFAVDSALVAEHPPSASPDSQEWVELSKPHLLFLIPSLHGGGPNTDLL